MCALEKRQTAIIKQLEQLRLKLNEMQTKLGASDIKSATAKKSTVQKQPAAVVAKPIEVSQSICRQMHFHLSFFLIENGIFDFVFSSYR